MVLLDEVGLPGWVRFGVYRSAGQRVDAIKPKYFIGIGSSKRPKQVLMEINVGRCGRNLGGELANGWPLPYNQDFAKLWAECHF
jgi:hypothetical protein